MYLLSVKITKCKCINRQWSCVSNVNRSEISKQKWIFVIRIRKTIVKTILLWHKNKQRYKNTINTQRAKGTSSMLPPTELSVSVLLSARPGGVWPGRARIWRPGPSAVAGWSAVESRPRPRPRCHRPRPSVRFARPVPATSTSCPGASPGGVPAPSAPPPPSSSPLFPVARGRSIAVAGSTPLASWRRTRPPYRISSCCATWVLFCLSAQQVLTLSFRN